MPAEPEGAGDLSRTVRPKWVRALLAVWLAATGSIGLAGAQASVAGAVVEVTPAIAAGDYFTCALDVEGKITCWGDGAAATPPAGTFTDLDAAYLQACAVATDGSITCWGDTHGTAPSEGAFTSVAVGDYHACAIKTDQSLVCWGDNTDGQSSPPGGAFIDVDLGQFHSCAVRADNAVLCWGDNVWGQTNAPTEGVFSSVSAGHVHSCALTSTGSITCWGVIDPPPAGESFEYISTGSWHGCAIGTDGQLTCWGDDESGQASPPSGTFTAVAAGEYHTCALATGGSIECWGANFAGQLNVPGNSLVPVVPGRILESRVGEGYTTADGQAQGIGRLAANSTTELVVAGRLDVPADASAAMLNVTAITPSGGGYLTVFPCGDTKPHTSNVNYSYGDVVANAVLAKIGTGGKVCIYTNTATDIIVDLNGYVPAGGSPTPITPARVLETRSGANDITTDHAYEKIGRRSAGSTTEMTITGRVGVPTDATAVLLNVTAISPSAGGYLTVFPCGETKPHTSNVNYTRGDVVPNAVLAKIGTEGRICIYTNAATDIIVDINAYVPAGGQPDTITPARILESRSGANDITTDGQYQGIGRRAADTTTELTVTGRAGVPTDATAVLVNVTAITPSANGYLTVYPCGQTRPLTSNVNYAAGHVVPNAVLAKIGAEGKICVYTNAPTDLIVDINGYVD